MAVDNVGMDVPIKFGDSRSNGFQDIRGADFVSNERTLAKPIPTSDRVSPKPNMTQNEHADAICCRPEVADGGISDRNVNTWHIKGYAVVHFEVANSSSFQLVGQAKRCATKIRPQTGVADVVVSTWL